MGLVHAALNLSLAMTSQVCSHIHAQTPGWQLDMLTHLVQELNIFTVYVVFLF